MTQEAKKKLLDYHNFIEQQLVEKKITEAIYFKQCLILATEFAVANDLQEVLALTLGITEKYYIEEMPAQLDADLMFLACVEELVKVMNDSGFMTMPNQTSLVMDNVFVQKMGLA